MDTGNVFSTPYIWSRQGNKAKEAFLTRFYQEEGYQAVALGWGDFGTLKEGMGRGLPWVSANGKGPGVEPYRLVKVGPWKVAVTAITGKGSFASPMKWGEPGKALPRVLKELSSKEVDLVILLVASPAEAGPYSQEVDVVLGGVYGRGKVNKKGPPYLFWLRKARGGQLGVVTLEKTDGGVKLVSYQPYLLDSRVPGDPGVLEELKEVK